MHRLFSVLFTALFLASSPSPANATELPQPERTRLVLGERSTCAIREAGAVWCWGAIRAHPAETHDRPMAGVVEGLEPALELYVTAEHFCALTTKEDIRCWRQDGTAEVVEGKAILAAGVQEFEARPVPELPAPFAEVAFGPHHGCARTTDENIYCWGRDEDNRLGQGTLVTEPRPGPIPGIEGATQLMPNRSGNCARVDGVIRCWGWFQSPRVSEHLASDFREAEPGVPGTHHLVVDSEEVRMLVAPVAFQRKICLLSIEGTLRCLPSQSGPLEEIALPEPAIAVAAGRSHVCALSEGRRVYCWGDNVDGQVGVKKSTRTEQEPREVALEGRAASLALGDNHSCAILEEGAVWCWGSNSHRQVGFAGYYTQHDPLPAKISGLDGATQIVAGSRFTCVLLSDLGVRCWGENDHFQLGAGPYEESQSPNHLQVVRVPEARHITAGTNHACALLFDGRVRCWGANGYGQLGDGTYEPRHMAVDVLGLDDVVELSAGQSHTCARRRDGTIWCWGSNHAEQLGRVTAPEAPRQVVWHRKYCGNGYFQHCSNPK